MAVGVWLKDLAGNLILGPDTQTIIATGMVTTGTSSGHVDDPKLAGGYPIIIAVLPLSGAVLSPPELAFNPSLNRLSWSFDGPGVDHRILYGVHC